MTDLNKILNKFEEEYSSDIYSSEDLVKRFKYDISFYEEYQDLDFNTQTAVNNYIDQKFKLISKAEKESLKLQQRIEKENNRSQQKMEREKNKLKTIELKETIDILLTLDYSIKLNSFTQCVEFNDHNLTDKDLSELRVRFQADFKSNVKINIMHEAVNLIADKNKYNPMIDYYNSLPKFDGNSKLDQLIDVMNVCSNRDLAKIFMKKWLLSIVNRAYNPGCKVDTVLILVGKQGEAKSTLFSNLCPKPEYFSDTNLNFNSKDVYQNLNGKLIIELAELSSFKKSDNDTIKNFITSQKDTYRKPYARTEITVPRTTVFCGTNNNYDFLTDPTGNRRFWVIEVNKRINSDWVKQNVDSIWAEIVHYYNCNEIYHLTEEEQKLSDDNNKNYESIPTIYDDVEQHILTMDNPKYFKLSDVIKGMGLRSDEEKKVIICLKKLGYQNKRLTINGKQERYWTK